MVGASASSVGKAAIVVMPVAVVAFSVAFKSVTAGGHNSCALGVAGETYCWGSNAFGNLGNEVQAAFRATRQKVVAPR